MSTSIAQLSDSVRARYDTLLEISESIVSHRQLSSLFADLYRCLKPLIAFDFMGLCLYDAERQVTRLHELVADQPVNCPPPRERKLGETPVQIVLETQQPYHVPDLERDGRFPAFNQMLLANDIHTYCSVPLSTAQRRLGALNFASTGKDAYTAGEIEFMGQVAKQV